MLATLLPLATSADQTGQSLGGIAGWAVDVMDALGGFGAALLIALENLFPPLPSEIILPLAGFTASQGSLGLLEVILWCTGGSVVGALALYGVGAALGRSRTRAIMHKLPLVKIEDVDRTEKFFDDHGPSTVFFGRMVPIFRSLISIPAGVTRMSLVKFTLLTTLGSAIWNTILIYAGYVLGENWTVVEGYVGIFSRIVLVLLVLWLVWFVVKRLRERKRGDDDGRDGRDAGNERDEDRANDTRDDDGAAGGSTAARPQA